MVVAAPLRAVVWAQWRMAQNRFLRANKLGSVVQFVTSLLWYGAWLAAAFGVTWLTGGFLPLAALNRAITPVLFFLFFFWQLMPILLASQGAHLDLRRLLAYPIPPEHLFRLEVLLRTTSALEMMLLALGLLIGVTINRSLTLWAPLAVLLFIGFNLLVSTGVKSLTDRLFRKRGAREVMMLVFIGLILLPQVFVAGLEGRTGPMPQLPFLKSLAPLLRILPWGAGSDLILGRNVLTALPILLAWCGAALLFARRQFAHTIRLEEDSAAQAKSNDNPTARTWVDRLASWPALILPDPLAMLMEKDLRTLFRAPRFRLILMMASCFGSFLFLPQALRDKSSWISGNYITMAVLYGMLVLGEVIYWNVFGFERAGAQLWFVTPIPFRKVLHAKNLTAAFFTALMAISLSSIALLLPLPVGLPQVFDGVLAAAVFLIFLLGAGNLTSVHSPRPVDADQAWRNNSSKTQFLLLFVYPLLSIPVILGYAARWATGNFSIYYWILGASFLAGLCFYIAATDSAAEAGERRKEEIVAALTKSDGAVNLSLT